MYRNAIYFLQTYYRKIVKVTFDISYYIFVPHTGESEAKVFRVVFRLIRLPHLEVPDNLLTRFVIQTFINSIKDGRLQLALRTARHKSREYASAFVQG